MRLHIFNKKTRNVYSSLLTRIHTILIVSLLFTLFSCSPYLEINRTTKEAYKNVEQYKKELSEKKQLNYDKVANKRIEYYKNYSFERQLNIKTIDEYKKMMGYHQVLVMVKDSSFYQWQESFKEQYDTLHASDKMASKRLIESLSGLQRIITESDIYSKTVCKLRDNGDLQCIPISSIIALFDTEMAGFIIRDIERLYELFEFDPVDEIIFECGEGYWGSVSQDESFGENNENLSTRAFYLCAHVKDAIGDTGPSLGNAGGFSGITGFDARGLMDCYMDWSSGTDFIDNFMKDIDEFSNKCESEFTETLMEGDSDNSEPDLTPIPPENTTQKTEQVTDNGDGTETVSGSTTVNGETSTYEFVRYRTNTPDGQRTSEQIRGEESFKITTIPEEGSIVERVDDEGNRKTESWFDKDMNHQQTSRYRKDENGNWKLKAFKVRNGEWKKYNSCTNESMCSSCEKFIKNLPPLLNAYFNEGTNTWTGQQYQAHGGDCCSDTEGFHADPRLVIPDPNGDFFCTGNYDATGAQESCEKKCLVAYHPDCISNCKESRELGKGSYDMLSHFCMYAISDECFNHAHWPFGEHPGLGNEDPIPLPTILRNHLLFPPAIEIDIFDFEMPYD